jgi:hypothetical protein
MTGSVIRNGFDIVEAWTRIPTTKFLGNQRKGNDVVAESDVDTAKLVTFIEAQTKRLKKTDPDEVSPMKLARAVAAMADLTDEAPPDSAGTVFLSVWKRADQCHHFWGPTVGQERFCTKCQTPRSAVDAVEETAPPRRRS